MKIGSGVKLALFLIALAVVIGIFVFNPSLGAIFGCLVAGFSHAVFGRTDVPSTGTGVEQVVSGLAEDQKRVGDIQDAERRTEKSVDSQAESLGRATDSVADAENILRDIKRSNPGK
jgi:hypothetical protein